MKISASPVIAVGALVVALSGSAAAATGGSFFNLGKNNVTTKTSTLKDRAGTPLSLVAGRGQPPLKVNSSKQVARLNASLLGGQPLSALQGRVTGSCNVGFAIRAIAPDGKVLCDSEPVSVLYVDATFANAAGGAGAVACPKGYVATGGGYVAASAAFASAASTLTAKNSAGKTVEGYAAVLNNPDGSAYTGQFGIEGRCIWGYSNPAPSPSPSTSASGAARPALTKPTAPSTPAAAGASLPVFGKMQAALLRAAGD